MTNVMSCQLVHAQLKSTGIYVMHTAFDFLLSWHIIKDHTHLCRLFFLQHPSLIFFSELNLVFLALDVVD